MGSIASKRRTCWKCKRNRDPKFYKGPNGRVCIDCQKGRVALAAREVRIWETYGITLEEYEEIRERQGGCCAICGRKPRYNMDVDHDHALEKAGVPIRLTIRGLLCKLCNRRLLTTVRDDVSTLRAAIDYLERGPIFRE